MKTANYEMFKFSKTNRPISQHHVGKIKDSIKKHGYFNSKPITVTPDMIITDGQHRYKACVELGIPVVYEIDNIDVNDSMVVLNTTSNIWRLNEFIYHYAQKGIPCYIELREFLIANPTLSVSNGIDIFFGHTGKLGPAIKKGVLLNKNPKLKETYELVMFFKGKLQFWNTSHFVRGLISFVNSSEQKHIEKLKQNTFGIIQCARVEQYTTLFNKLTRKKQTTKNKQL